jgi:hypothetical protein
MDRVVSMVAGSGVCAVIITVGVISKLSGDEITEMPPLPPEPPPVATTKVVGDLRFTESYYRAMLDEDSKRYGISPPVTAEQMGAPFPYFLELAQPKRLTRPRDYVDTPHLRIGFELVNDWVGAGSLGGGIKTNYAQLTIENKTTAYLAYRVDTRMSTETQCGDVPAMAHTANAIRPLDVVRRSECLWGRSGYVSITRVEVMEINQLSYDYLNRLNAAHLLIAPRVARQHEATGGGRPCSTVPWVAMQPAIHAGELMWRDIVDYYARHSCDEYAFPLTYRYHEQPVTLPAQH